MAEERLIIVEEDANNAVGFRLNDIQRLDYEERDSGVGTVQVLMLDLGTRKVTFSGADAVSVYGTIKASFSAGGASASPDPLESTQVAILAALELLDDIVNALSSEAGGVLVRVGSDGVPLELAATP